MLPGSSAGIFGNFKIPISLDFDFSENLFGCWMELVFGKTEFQSKDVWIAGCWENSDLGPFPNNQRRNAHGGVVFNL